MISQEKKPLRFPQGSEIVMRKMEITPSMAKDYLDRCNTDNYRKPIQTVVTRYASDMKSGRWTETTATIAFTKSGVLIDGQNRLLAVVRSGATISFNVIEGLDDSILHDPNQDRGSCRKISTTLQHLGYKNANVVASCVRMLHRIASNSKHRSGNMMISDSAVIDVLSSMPEEFINCVNFVAASALLKKTVTPSCLATFLWLATCDDQSTATIFIEVMAKKLDGNAFCSANCIREQLSSMRLTKRPSDSDVLNLLFSAYQSFRLGKDCKLIRKTLTLSLTSAMVSELERIKNVVGSCVVTHATFCEVHE